MKIRIEATQEVHHTLLIDADDYYGVEKATTKDVCDLFHRVSSDPMRFILDNEGAESEAGDIRHTLIDLED